MLFLYLFKQIEWGCCSIEKIEFVYSSHHGHSERRFKYRIKMFEYFDDVIECFQFN